MNLLESAAKTLNIHITTDQVPASRDFANISCTK